MEPACIKMTLLVFIAVFAMRAKSQTEHSIGSGTGCNCTTVQEILRISQEDTKQKVDELQVAASINQEIVTSELRNTTHQLKDTRRQVEELQVAVSINQEIVTSELRKTTHQLKDTRRQVEDLQETVSGNQETVSSALEDTALKVDQLQETVSGNQETVSSEIRGMRRQLEELQVSVSALVQLIRDINECLTADYDCHQNATCINTKGSYDCQCNQGFVGDGKGCVPVDRTVCGDTPCFDGVQCIDIPLNLNNIDLSSATIVRLYRCGSCPAGFEGDGKTCNGIPPPIVVPQNVSLTVVVIDSAPPPRGSPLVRDATVTAYVADESTGSTRYAASETGYSGFTKLAVPHNESVVITVSHESFLTKSQSFKAHLLLNNTLTIELFRFSELTQFLWTSATSRAFEFEDLLSLEIPKGGLQVRNGERVTIECRPLNMSLIQGPSEGPELVAGIRNGATGEVELTGIEVFGMAELRCFVPKRSRNSAQKKKPAKDTMPFTISMPVIDLVQDPESPLYAWRYHDEKGYWVLEGEISGVTGVPGDDSVPASANEEQVTRLMWQYFARNFTYSWWAFGRAWESSSCVTAWVCYDLACVFPVENALIELYGVDFRYTASRYTGVDGTVSFKYKTGGQVVLRAPCIDQQKALPFSSQYPPSNCPAPGDEGILTPRKGVAIESAVMTFIYTDRAPQTCGPPEHVDGAQRFGDVFTHGNEVIYTCDDRANTLENSTRVCLKCGEWSGDTPSCSVEEVSAFYSY